MKSLYEILTQTAQKFPEKIALAEVGGKQITYEELLNKSQLVLQKIHELKLGPGHRVGLLVSKKIETVAAIFGIAASGATFVPMDAEAPVVRNLFILEDCQLNALLIGKNLLSTYEQVLSDQSNNSSARVSIFDFSIFHFSHQSLNLAINKSEDPAFILYTSGSTGQPKGVMITHQNALSFILWANQTFTFSEKDVFASIAPLHFDLSVFDLYVAILNGATLQLINAKTARNPRMLAHLIDERKISVWYATPTLLKLMLNYGKLERFDHGSLRYVLFAGEVFPIQPLKQIKKAWPQVEFYNLYGPTETNVCTFFKIPQTIETQKTPFPIGKACSFGQVKIVDPQQEGEETKSGELWVAGASVSPGYWQAPEKNAEAFVHDQNGRRWYKTGDWVFLDSDGNYCFVGRKDRMVKRRGYRIELAEIEAALHQHPQVLTAAVVANQKGAELELKAYYQKKVEDVEIDLLELQQFCLRIIPNYMLPDAFIQLKEMPQTSTQKVDYQKLQNR